MSDTPLEVPSGVVLVAEKLCKRFGGVQALNGVGIEARYGEVTGLIGPNGAGKSTLLSVLAGSCVPDSGRVVLEGVQLPSGRPERVARLGLARTFQQASPIPDLTVLENVLLGASRSVAASMLQVAVRSRGLARKEHAILEAAMTMLERLELKNVANRRASALSFGQLRLLEIARALMTKPKVLLLDEPVAGLNKVETAQLAGVLKSIAAEGMGLILVDHDVPFIMDLCAKIFALDYGTVIAVGTPAEIEGSPAVRAAYLGGEADSSIPAGNEEGL